jgi:hypothetical protein
VTGRRASAPRRGRARKSRRGPSRLTWVAGTIALASTTFVAGVIVTARAPDELDTAENPVNAWTGEERVRVEVLNAGGVAGMAASATDRLREAGFDVVHFGNAGSFDAGRPSAVIDRVGRADFARAVAASLGIDNVLSEPDPNLFLDVTVVVGGGWMPGGPVITVGPADDPPRWDPRSWFGS